MDVTLAVCRFAADYHSGQFSRGYRLLCGCMRRLERAGILRPLDRAPGKHECEIYRMLVYRYRNEI